jgi:hypothetical protein
MQHYKSWAQFPELIRTTAIYRNYLRANLKTSLNLDRDLKRYAIISNLLFAYQIDDYMPDFYDGLDSIELEVILQMHGVDVDLV